MTTAGGLALYPMLYVCVCLCVDAPLGSVNVMKFVILKSKRDKCALNNVADVQNEGSCILLYTAINNGLPNGGLNHSAAELNLFLTQMG